MRTLTKADWFQPDGFPLAVERREPQEPFEPHTHEFTELVVVTGGGGRHFSGTASWPLTPGDVFVISGDRPHHYADLADLHLVNVLFDADALGLDPDDLADLPGYHALFTLEPAWRERHDFRSRLHLAPAELARVRAAVDALGAELARRAPGFRFVARARWMELIGELARLYAAAPHARTDPDRQALMRLAGVIPWLREHSAERITVDDLARRAAMPRRSFVRAFRAAAGTSPVDYLLQLRIDRAADLLRRTDAPITTIAFTVGFCDSSYFGRQFRRRTGLAPGAWRDRQRTLDPGAMVIRSRGSRPLDAQSAEVES